MRLGKWMAAGIVCGGLAGCLGLDDGEMKTSFRPPVPSGSLPPLTPASTETASRVDVIGRRILAANPQIGARPMFRTIGSPEPEVFHNGTADVFVTEGLVKQCCTDGQLAAVLCTELGKLVAEREALAAPAVRNPDRLPPIDMRLGVDQMGSSPDRTEVRELAEYDAGRRPNRAPVPLPDPQALTRNYLQRAGYQMNDLANVEPILHAAGDHSTFERQITKPAGPKLK